MGIMETNMDIIQMRDMNSSYSAACFHNTLYRVSREVVRLDITYYANSLQYVESLLTLLTQSRDSL